MRENWAAGIVRQSNRIKLVFFLLAIAALFTSILKIDNLLISLIVAFVISYWVSPAVDFLERRGLSRTLATTLPFLVLGVSLVILGEILFPILLEQGQNLKQHYPQYNEALSNFVLRQQTQLNAALEGIYIVDLKSQFQTRFMDIASTVFQDLPNYLSKSLMVLFLSPLIAFFMLIDGRIFIRRIINLVPNNLFELTLNLQHQVASQMGGFIRARIIQSLLVSVVIWVGLLVIHFPYALVLALVAGILNVIPYLGPIIGALPALVICFANGGSAGDIALISIIYGVAQAVDAVLITPLVVAKIVDLHPITVILVIIAGSQVMSILGMIICIPIFSALKVSTIAIYKHLTDFRT